MTISPLRRAAFLDRDGVITEMPRDAHGALRPPHSLDELRLLPDVPRALGELRALGYTTIVVTNQPDVARGTLARETVEALNDAIRETWPIDDILVCYHDDDDGCDCRKPAPGLLLEGARRWHVALEQSFMIGDRWRDVIAGQRARCRTILVEGHDEPLREGVEPDFRVASLLAAATLIRELGAV